MRRDEQVFNEAVSEVGSGLLLVAGFGLLIPSAFYNSLYSGNTGGDYPRPMLEDKVLTISRATSIILLVAFFIYVYFQMRYFSCYYQSSLLAKGEFQESRRDLRRCAGRGRETGR